MRDDGFWQMTKSFFFFFSFSSFFLFFIIIIILFLLFCSLLCSWLEQSMCVSKGGAKVRVLKGIRDAANCQRGDFRVWWAWEWYEESGRAEEWARLVAQVWRGDNSRMTQGMCLMLTCYILTIRSLVFVGFTARRIWSWSSVWLLLGCK